MTFWKSKYFKYFFLSLAIILFFASISKNKRNLDYPYAKYIWGDTISCAVLLPHEAKATGNKINYIYDIFKNLEENQNCNIALSLQDNTLEQWGKLASNDLDMLIINSDRDTVPQQYEDLVISGIPLNRDQDVCVVTKENYKLLQTINYWFTYFIQDPKYEKITKHYYNNPKRVKKPDYLTFYSISKFDKIVKHYSNQKDLDWRLISALIYQESRFKQGVSSSRGAIGLMQIKRDIARRYGATDIYDPEQNIKAGVYHFAKLRDDFNNLGADPVNAIKMALAAYNCGEGRIQDCMTIAKSEGKNSLVWEDVEDIIPLMSEQEFIRRDDIKLGRFRGKETIRFVNHIMERYEKYKETVSLK